MFYCHPYSLSLIHIFWDEVGRPGYGLYDRALGIAYLNGLWEAIDKNSKRG